LGRLTFLGCGIKDDGTHIAYVFGSSHHMAQAEYETMGCASQHTVKTCLPIFNTGSIDCVHQLYEYMTFNEHKYGILNNMQDAWFFQETADREGKSLHYGPINFDVDSVHYAQSLCGQNCPPGFTLLYLMPKHPPVDTLAELSSCDAAIAQVQFTIRDYI